MNPWTPLALATVGWASSVVLSRALLLGGVNTWTLIPLRMVVALTTLGVILVFSKRFRTLDPTAWKRGLVLGTVAMAFPMVLMTLGLEDLPVSLGSMLVALIPIATIGAAHFLVDDERFQARSLPGLLVALVGTGLLVGVGGVTLEGVDNLWRGVLFTMIGVIVAGIGGALSRRYAMEMSSDRLVLPQFTVNTLFVVIVLPLFFDFDIGTVTGNAWWAILGVGTLGTTVAFGSFLIAAALNPASRLALTGYSVPVVAVTLAVIFLGEVITLPILAGAVLIIAGVVMAERATKHVPEPGVVTAR